MFDETHIEQSRLSSSHASKKQIRLPRDDDGGYNPNGKYRPERTETTYKYYKQAKLCLGVAAVKYNMYEKNWS